MSSLGILKPVPCVDVFVLGFKRSTPGSLFSSHREFCCLCLLTRLHSSGRLSHHDYRSVNESVALLVRWFPAQAAATFFAEEVPNRLLDVVVQKMFLLGVSWVLLRKSSRPGSWSL